MVQAYLRENDHYWKSMDELPTQIGKWRNGSVREAVAVSYRAMLAASPQADTQPSEQAKAQE